jgi:hypothetical protein
VLVSLGISVGGGGSVAVGCGGSVGGGATVVGIAAAVGSTAMGVGVGDAPVVGPFGDDGGRSVLIAVR